MIILKSKDRRIFHSCKTILKLNIGSPSINMYNWSMHNVPTCTQINNCEFQYCRKH